MRDVTVAFVDFWPAFDEKNNFILDVLRQKYNVETVAASDCPDILFYSYFGIENLRHTEPVRVYFTGENDVPDFNLCDYAISFHHLSFANRHLRLPLYVIYSCFNDLRNGRIHQCEDTENRDFCSMVVSNVKNSDMARLDFFNLLSGYKQVASGGRFANNVGGCVADKLSFISGYKFNIAFENSRVEGYVTEKIIEAFSSGTLPIYWGDPLVANEFNHKAFIDVSKFDSLDAAVKFVAALDNNREQYLEILNQPPLLNNPFLNWEEMLLDFLTPIVNELKKYRVDTGAIGTAYRHKMSREQIYNIVTLKKPFELLTLTMGHPKLI